MTLEVVDEEPLASYGFFSVAHLRLRGPWGRDEQRTVVRHPGAVVVVALRPDGVVIAQRQYRAAIARTMLELPAGKRDVPGEPVLACAARELEEECGIRATVLTEVGTFYNSPGFTDERTWVVAATGLEPAVRAPQSIEEETMALVGIRLASLDDLLAEGVLEDAKSIVALGLVRARLKKLPRPFGAIVLPELEVLGSR